jgi:XXXCH domain-containing protein
MDFSKIKHEMAAIFDQITAQTDVGLLPDETAVGKFARLCQRMHQIADDAWIGEAEDFSHLSSQLLIAVKKGDVENSIMLAESLHDSQAYCHRMFRD